ncbi:hypothetical protein CLAIMM_04614 isoform 2 [Cladophialophora immunda]|nr:hypothetical protein CLAIMM_04614 isoform 2 [Cladophialophora immunda]
MDSRARRPDRSITFSLAALFVAVILATRWYSSASSQVPAAVETNAVVINPLTAGLRELQSALGSGTVRSVDLVQLYTDQIQKYDDSLKAMINFKPLPGVFEAAEILDKERSQGKTRGPLHGIPIVIKGGFVPLFNDAGLIFARQDNIDTHPDLGFQTTAGSYALVGSWPQRNAKIVDLLIAAGVIIIGKTNLSELSNYKGTNITSGYSAVGGQVQSAYVRDKVDPADGKDSHSNPSGSSSGSAVAVSAGYSPFSIGTETDGSLILPAGRAALYTIKPTIGLVPQAGIVPISSNFDSAGPMAKSSYDLAVLLDAIVDPDRKLPQSYTSALTESWSDISVATLDPEVWNLPDSWLRHVENATQQMNREIRQAYAKIETLAKSYAGNVPLTRHGALTLNGQNSETVVAGRESDVNTISIPD